MYYLLPANPIKQKRDHGNLYEPHYDQKLGRG
jgi:hypothetical protein